jgi:hypothetical protein
MGASSATVALKVKLASTRRGAVTVDPSLAGAVNVMVGGSSWGPDEAVPALELTPGPEEGGTPLETPWEVAVEVLGTPLLGGGSEVAVPEVAVPDEAPLLGGGSEVAVPDEAPLLGGGSEVAVPDVPPLLPPDEEAPLPEDTSWLVETPEAPLLLPTRTEPSGLVRPVPPSPSVSEPGGVVEPQPPHPPAARTETSAPVASIHVTECLFAMVSSRG